MLFKIKKNNSIIFILIVCVFSPIQILSKDIIDTRKARKKQVLLDETFEISTKWINKNNYPAKKRTIKWEKIKNTYLIQDAHQ